MRFSKDSVDGALCGSLALAALILAACSPGHGPTPELTRAQAVGLALGPKYIYVTDVSQSKLLVYPAGVPNPTPSSTTVPDKPHGVVTDASGYVYVASSESNQVEVYNSGATALEYTIQSSRLDKPQGLALDAAGDLYAATLITTRSWSSDLDRRRRLSRHSSRLRHPLAESQSIVRAFTPM